MTSDACVHDRCRHTCVDCGEEIGTESHDQAYQNGYSDAHAESDEAVEDKDDFIERQGLIIQAMMNVVTEARAWAFVPADVYEELRNYV